MPDTHLSQRHAEQYGSFIANCPMATALLDTKGNVLHANTVFAELTGLQQKGSPPSLFDAVKPENHADLHRALDNAFAGKKAEKPCPVELISQTNDTRQERLTASIYLTILPSAPDTPPALVAHFVETTEQKNLEMRFAHSQKMQAVGQLAGGIAHDFNNLLTAMIGFCDLLLMRHPAGDPSFADIMQVKQNANRAANLVRQLLAFSRRQTLQPKVLDITDVLAELSHLIRRLIGENIQLQMQHGRGLSRVRVDQGQLEQVIINLAVNARDAMTGTNGTLTIRTSDTVITQQNHPARSMISPSEDDTIAEGRYILVEVGDTGCGIPKELIQQIFEPFFSTKEVGSGTGLGLATVYGIVKQTGGYIYVASTAGKGTTFHLYFPSVDEQGAQESEHAAEKPAALDLTGSGTILLVEDETPVRTFASRALSNKGYKVLEADSAETALQIVARSGPQIQVIITDVIMPGMTGPDMIEKIIPQYPHIRVIFISGYAEDAFVNCYGTEREFNFLPKPFTLKQLASKVKEVMG